MEESHYPFTITRTEYRYEFVSKSKTKEIRKVVLLTQTEITYIYNLALLDLLESEELSDMAESNNSDLRTVLATVIQIIKDFLEKNPHFFVLFRGSDERRQRLYRIVISRELTEITKHFTVFGLNGGVPFPFQMNSSCEFYLIGNL